MVYITCVTPFLLLLYSIILNFKLWMCLKLVIIAINIARKISLVKQGSWVICSCSNFSKSWRCPFVHENISRIWFNCFLFYWMSRWQSMSWITPFGFIPRKECICGGAKPIIVVTYKNISSLRFRGLLLCTHEKTSWNRC